MLAPEDNIDFNKKSIVYENKTYRSFEKLLTYFKYWELLEAFILFPLIFGGQSLTPYLVDFLLLFEVDYNGIFLYPAFVDNFAYVICFILLIIFSYQIYKSIDNMGHSKKLGARFYVFQTLKVTFYISTLFNLLLFFAIIGIARMVAVFYFSKTKSFK